MFLTASQNNGSTFLPSINLHSITTSEGGLALAVDKSHPSYPLDEIYLAWDDVFDIYFTAGTSDVQAHTFTFSNTADISQNGGSSSQPDFNAIPTR